MKFYFVTLKSPVKGNRAQVVFLMRNNFSVQTALDNRPWFQISHLLSATNWAGFQMHLIFRHQQRKYFISNQEDSQKKSFIARNWFPYWKRFCFCFRKAPISFSLWVFVVFLYHTTQEASCSGLSISRNDTGFRNIFQEEVPHRWSGDCLGRNRTLTGKSSLKNLQSYY